MNRVVVWAALACVAIAAAAPAEPPEIPVDLAPEPLQQADVVPSTARLWLAAEYLAWWLKDSPLPVALATRGAAAELPPGAIGQPGTTIVLGAQDVDCGSRSGGRFSAGAWLDAGGWWGVEGSYFFLAPRTIHRSAVAPGSSSAVLAVPFFNVATAREDVVGFPGPGASSIGLALAGDLQGADANGVCVLYGGASWRLDGMLGYRFLAFAEELRFSTHGHGPGDVFLDTIDEVDAANRFHGGQVGLRLTCEVGKLYFRAVGKAALGAMQQRVTLFGAAATNSIPGAADDTYPGGIFVQPSNSGDYVRNRRTIVAEADVQVGYCLTSWASLFVGWTYLTADKVVRPGNHLDRSGNPTRTAVAAALGTDPVGPARPEFDFKEAPFWTQGLIAGLELRY